jgi:hypothetical protein
VQVGLYNATDQLSGLQMGVWNQSASGMRFGIQLGLVNKNNIATEQFGIWNIADAAGLQGGIVNIANSAFLQLGYFNSVYKLRGVQFGLWNHVGYRGWGLPLINFGWIE